MDYLDRTLPPDLRDARRRAHARIDAQRNIALIALALFAAIFFILVNA